MTKKETASPVVFRVGLREGEVFALFPTLPSDIYGHFCTCYEHVGQHSSADYHGCIRTSRPTKGREAAYLIRELKQRGYRLRIVNRATPAMHDERIDSASRERAPNEKA